MAGKSSGRDFLGFDHTRCLLNTPAFFIISSGCLHTAEGGGGVLKDLKRPERGRDEIFPRCSSWWDVFRGGGGWRTTTRQMISPPRISLKTRSRFWKRRWAGNKQSSDSAEASDQSEILWMLDMLLKPHTGKNNIQLQISGVYRHVNHINTESGLLCWTQKWKS